MVLLLLEAPVDLPSLLLLRLQLLLQSHLLFRSVVLEVQLANATSFNETQIAALYDAVLASITGINLNDVSITFSNGSNTITITVEVRGASIAVFDNAFSAANSNQTLTTFNANLVTIPGVAGVSGVQIVSPPVSPPTAAVPPTASVSSAPSSGASVPSGSTQPTRASSTVRRDVTFALVAALLVFVSLVL
jgi:hypothetical protein